jgi:hypothetical protein
MPHDGLSRGSGFVLMAAIGLPQQTGGWSRVSVHLSIERFCAVEGGGKELAKLWVWMKTTEQTPFLASVSEAHE